MSSTQLIQALQNAGLYDHPVIEFKLLETHISWVILTGRFAYKIKKPVDFEVLDFSTLDKRKFCCEEEVRLNKQLAPELYVGVVVITGSAEAPQINGNGPVIEYAIKMHEFSQEEIFTRVLARHELTYSLIDKLAKVIADFHAHTAIAPESSEFGTPEHAHFPVIQNFTQMLPWLTAPADKAQIHYLQNWAVTQYEKYLPLLAKRKKTGFIRDCHGDLHLGNIILHDGRPILFDRIEFNPDLRWTDVIADIAFLMMDLQDHQQMKLANRLINMYLTYTGDYEGLSLLNYYLSYRAMVRAKVDLFRLNQGGLDDVAQKALKQKYRNFIGLGERYTHTLPPKLIITYGLAGSGKSTVARTIVEEMGAIQISSDVERKRLFNLPLDAQTNAGLNQGIYSPEATVKTYARLLELAKIILAAGFTVIVDATFMKQQQRDLFNQLANELQVPFIILHCEVARERSEAWLKQRKMAQRGPSEAGIEVLQLQADNIEKLASAEQNFVFTIDPANFSADELISKIINRN